MPAYKKDLDDQHIVFPDILPPNELMYEVNGGLNDLFYSTMAILTDTPHPEDNPTGKGLHYARLRMGIGNDYPRGGQIDWVLGKYTEEDMKQLQPRCV